VFGGKHADVPITRKWVRLSRRLIANQTLAGVIDLSELGNNSAR
jgi:hypothetical protein